MESTELDCDALIKEKYLRMKELIDLKFSKDPESEPYKSKYEARDLLLEMERLLKDRMSSKEEEDIKDTAMLAAVYTILGTISMDVEEPATGENYLHQSLKLMDQNNTNPYYVLSSLCTLNQIALLYSLRQDDEKALIYLERSDGLYREYKELGTSPPVSYQFLFTGIQCDIDKYENDLFEKTHTLTLYYMAQVYKGLGSTVESALYCHNTLRRQLETKDYDKIDWALNAASLSQYLAEKNAFKEARHHLAAASYMLSLRMKELDAVEDKNEEHEANLEQHQHRKSDVYRCWTKYSISLLSRSKERLMSSDDDNTNSITPPPAVLSELNFPSLDLQVYENMVACNYLLTYDDAKPVFLFGQSCCNKSMEYYTLNDHASDYVVIIQDSSQLYSYLTFFEDDEIKQSKLYKKRKDILKKTVSELNETYYLDVCRELWLEIGIVCSSITEVKASQVSKTRSAHLIAKLNHIAQESLEYLEKFISSFNDKRMDKPPETYQNEFERDILMAHMYAAQMYSKFINPDKTKMIEFTSKSLSYYQTIVEYCTRNPKATEDFQAEFRISKDMVGLLPVKMNKLASQIL